MKNINSFMQAQVASNTASASVDLAAALSGWRQSIRQGTRIGIALCAAPLVIFALLLLMSKLIENTLPEPEPSIVINTDGIFDVPKPTPPVENEPPEKIDEVTEPPKIDDEWLIEGGEETFGDGLAIDVDGAGDLTINLGDSSAPIRLVPVAPEYPRPAIMKEIEGFVDVRFDVNKSGNTENIEIVAYEPSKIFNRSVLKAVSRWRYQPRLVDGEPTATQGIVERVRFNLEGS